MHSTNTFQEIEKLIGLGFYGLLGSVSRYHENEIDRSCFLWFTRKCFCIFCCFILKMPMPILFVNIVGVLLRRQIRRAAALLSCDNRAYIEIKIVGEHITRPGNHKNLGFRRLVKSSS